MPAQITALPTPPSTNDPANFNTRADAFLGQMPTFVSQANALAGEVNASTVQVAADRVQTGSDRTAAAASAASALGAPGTNGSSTTSLTIGTGTKAFTTQTGKAWIAGQGFFLASSASPANWMTGILTAYNSGTGAATLEVDTVGGSGTFAAWNCGLAAGRPLAVATQAQAEAGADAMTVMTPQRTAQAAVAFGVPVGGVIQSVVNPGSRWLPCTGLVYLKASYPPLGAILPSYVRPIALRQSGYQAGPLSYGGGVFVGWLNGVPYTSPDGVAWTQRSLSWTTPARLSYGGGLFVASNNYSIYTSPDGVTWTSRTHPFSTQADARCLVYGGGYWIMCSFDSEQGMFLFSRTTDFVTWSAAVGLTSSLNTIAYNANTSRWVALSSVSAGLYSVNGGQSWTAFSPSLPSPPLELIYGGGKFLLRTQNGNLFSSVDGTSGFTQVSTAPFNGQHILIYYDGTNFVVLGDNGKLARSADLTTWTVVDGTWGTNLVGFARASGAITSPSVFSISSLGIYSGLDTSVTEFAAPTVANAATNVAAYIKAT